jgi:hypothetical protein
MLLLRPELAPHIEEAERKQQKAQRQWDEQRQRGKEEEERARLLKAHETARQELYTAIAAWMRLGELRAPVSDTRPAKILLCDTPNLYWSMGSISTALTDPQSWSVKSAEAGRWKSALLSPRGPDTAAASWCLQRGAEVCQLAE